MYVQRALIKVKFSTKSCVSLLCCHQPYHPHPHPHHLPHHLKQLIDVNRLNCVQDGFKATPTLSGGSAYPNNRESQQIINMPCWKNQSSLRKGWCHVEDWPLGLLSNLGYNAVPVIKSDDPGRKKMPPIFQRQFRGLIAIM